MNGEQIGFLMATRPQVLGQMAKAAGMGSDLFEASGLPSNRGMVGDAAHSVGEGIGSLAGKAKEGLGGMAGKAKEGLGSAASFIGDKAKGAFGSISGAAQRNPKTALTIALLTALGAGAGGHALMSGGGEEKK